MRKPAGPILASLVCLLAAVAFGQSIQTDFDRSYDLSKLQTFQIAKFQRDAQDALVSNPIVDKRIAGALRAQLVTSGMKEADEPQFFIAYYASLKERTEVRAYGWGRPYWGGGTATFEPEHYTEGTLVVDFIDAQTKTPVWRGTVTDTVEPNRKHDKLDKAIAKLLDKFKKDVAAQQKKKG